MSNNVTFLITLLSRSSLSTIKVALKFRRDLLSEDCIQYYMELEHRNQIQALLPENCQNMDIIEISHIFDAVIIE